jgi:hypothetical protein
MRPLKSSNLLPSLLLILAATGCGGGGSGGTSTPEGAGTAALTWGASPVDADHGAPEGYRIYRATTSGGAFEYFATVGNVLEFTASNLPPGTHCFQVRAYNAAGESDPATCSSGDCCKSIPAQAFVALPENSALVALSGGGSGPMKVP